MLRNAKSFVGKKVFCCGYHSMANQVTVVKADSNCGMFTVHKFHFFLLDFVWVFFSIFTAFKAKRNCLEVCLYEYLTFYFISFSESKMDRKDKLFVINEVSLKSAVN